MEEENIFENFENVKRIYFKLIDIFEEQSFNESDLQDIKKFYKRIKINNSILAILNIIERLNISQLKEKELQSILNCFNQSNINLVDFRNCLAHAHYNINSDFSKISFKKGNFELDLEIDELERLARKINETIKNNTDTLNISFDGLKLNEFLDKLVNGENSIDTDVEAYATVIQSYNIYHAYMFEKLVQLKEQKNFSSYLKNKIMINLNLPYINQFKTQEFIFDSLKFEELSELSKADLLYYILTSEFREETLNCFKEIFHDNDEKEVLKKIAISYFYGTDEYKDFALNFFKSSENEDRGSLEKKLLEYKEKNIIDTNEDERKIINLMLMRLPKMGRIKDGRIIPDKRTLFFGFETRDNDKTFIYPDFNSLVDVGTQKSFVEKYIKESEEISKQYTTLEIVPEKIITTPELAIFLSEKIDEFKVSEELRDFFEKIRIQKQKTPDEKPGKIYSQVLKDFDKKSKKDIGQFISKVPERYKEDVSLLKLKSLIKEKDFYSAYKIILLLLRNKLKQNKPIENLLEFKNHIEKNLKEDNSIFKGKIPLLDLGSVYNLLEDVSKNNSTKYIDFTDIITHIRDASIHALAEVDYSRVDNKQFVIRKDTPYKDKGDELDNIMFTFQDYIENSGDKKTTFLISNISSKKVMALIDMGSDVILHNELERTYDNHYRDKYTYNDDHDDR